MISDNKLTRKDDSQNKLKTLANQIIKIEEDEVHSNNKVYNGICQRSINNTVLTSICWNQINDNISMVSFNDSESVPLTLTDDFFSIQHRS